VAAVSLPSSNASIASSSCRILRTCRNNDDCVPRELLRTAGKLCEIIREWTAFILLIAVNDLDGDVVKMVIEDGLSFSGR